MTHNSTPADELADRLAELAGALRLHAFDDSNERHMPTHLGNIAADAMIEARNALRQPPSDAIRNAVIEECAKALAAIEIPLGGFEDKIDAWLKAINIGEAAIRALAQDNHIKGQDNAGGQA